jgi:hypothetical protein
MTVREKLENLLISNGMSENQASEVMNIAIPKLNDIVNGYGIKFNGDANDYPNEIYNALYFGIKPIALEWIEKYIPMAWFKPMFQ